jgi:hypothetical protein
MVLLLFSCAIVVVVVVAYTPLTRKEKTSTQLRVNAIIVLANILFSMPLHISIHSSNSLIFSFLAFLVT